MSEIKLIEGYSQAVTNKLMASVYRIKANKLKDFTILFKNTTRLLKIEFRNALNSILPK